MIDEKDYLNGKPAKTFREKTKPTQKLILETLFMLDSFGIPIKKKTPRLQEKLALAVLSLSDMKEGKKWAEAKDINDVQRTTREIISDQNKKYGEDRSSGSYDDVRREDMKELVLAEIILRSKPGAATNDPTRKYGLSPNYANVVRAFGTKSWNGKLKEIILNKGELSKKISGDRKIKKIPVRISKDVIAELTPGMHNVLQKKIIDEFLPRFCPDAELFYLGDTAKKQLVMETKKLKSLNFFELKHDILPDIIAYNKKKNWLYLIEAVYSANPFTHTRKIELDGLTKKCKAEIVYVSAFFNKNDFRKWITKLAWETEVWLVEDPDHMIHFNGDKFLGPYKRDSNTQ